VVKFINTAFPEDMKMPRNILETTLLKDIWFVQDDDTLRAILSLNPGVGIRTYPISSSREIVI